MDIQVKDLGDCKVQVVYTADTNVVVNKRKESYKQLRNAPIPGYRPGKATDIAIKQYALRNHQVKHQLDTWVKTELATQAYDDILFETKIKPIGRPELTSLELGDMSFTCEMNIMKKPEFTLKDYKSMEIPKPALPTNSSEFAEKMLQDLRKQNGTIEPYGENDFVQAGDQITLDFEIKVDDQIIGDGKQEGQLYNVGEGNVFPEFDQNILGMSAGETREFDLVLPENFKDVAGKQAHVKVTVHMGTKRIPAALDDDLAVKLGLKDYNDLRTQLEQVATQKVQSMEMALVAQQIVKRLVADNSDFEIPEWLYSMEAQYSAANEQKKWAELNDEEKLSYTNRAKEGVRLALILDSIQEQDPESCLSDAEAIGIVKSRIQEVGRDVEQTISEMQSNGQLVGAVAALKNEFTVQFLAKRVKIIE